MYEKVELVKGSGLLMSNDPLTNPPRDLGCDNSQGRPAEAHRIRVLYNSRISISNKIP